MVVLGVMAASVDVPRSRRELGQTRQHTQGTGLSTVARRRHTSVFNARLVNPPNLRITVVTLCATSDDARLGALRHGATMRPVPPTLRNRTRYGRLGPGLPGKISCAHRDNHG